MTADFDCSRSGSFRTVFGARLRFLFAMECGLQSPWRKHYSVLDFLTSSAFPSIDPVKLFTSRLRARNTFRFAKHLRHLTMGVIASPRHSPSPLATIPSCRDLFFCCTCAPPRRPPYALSLAFCDSQCRDLGDLRPTLGWSTLQHIAAASSE
jgi:hypothetical protein